MLTPKVRRTRVFLYNKIILWIKYILESFKLLFDQSLITFEKYDLFHSKGFKGFSDCVTRSVKNL